MEENVLLEPDQPAPPDSGSLEIDGLQPQDPVVSEKAEKKEIDKSNWPPWMEGFGRNWQNPISKNPKYQELMQVQRNRQK